MVTLLRDQTAVTGQAPFEALAAASHPQGRRHTSPSARKRLIPLRAGVGFLFPAGGLSRLCGKV
jgi:hypothetical protein